VMPFNLNLLRNTHPQMRFGQGLELQQNAFRNIFEENYRQRRNGFQNWLPTSIALPNHIVRQPIDYRGYPPYEAITGVTAWKVLLKVNGGTGVEIYRAKQIGAVSMGSVL
jgi:hypothetical protein